MNNNELMQLAEMLFHNISESPEYYEEKYPQRNLPENANVTRIGPSPTGFVHLGNLYNAIIGERLAHQSNGVFYLRIEDTDNKREVAGAVEIVINAMKYFGIEFDEGATIEGDNGKYAPYRQRQRKDIYQCFAKELVKQGKAYPCFCSEDELAEMRKEQESIKANYGYYGKWAVYRDKSLEEIKEKLDAGIPYVLRYKSSGDESNYITITDGIRGELKIQENYQDFVLLKSDGIPTYHFAHVVDDHLMRTTHVVRGEEWLSTLPIHIQLFDTFNWKKPIYCHTPQLMKLDGSSKRKLSKRKDPELALEYYTAEGFIPETIWTYLLTILNSNFEEWLKENPDKHYSQFEFSLNKMSNSGALFDLLKLQDIGKDVICRMSADEVYEKLSVWSEKYNTDFHKVFTANPEYTLKVLSIGRTAEKPRKDIYNWKQACEFLSFYYDELFVQEDDYPENANDKETCIEILSRYYETYNHEDSQNEWFEKIRTITEELGYAVQPKKYKKNPEAYRGSIVDVSNVIRVATTGRLNSPDIYEINQSMGKERTLARIKKAIDKKSN